MVMHLAKARHERDSLSMLSPFVAGEPIGNSVAQMALKYDYEPLNQGIGL